MWHKAKCHWWKSSWEYFCLPLRILKVGSYLHFVFLLLLILWSCSVLDESCCLWSRIYRSLLCILACQTCWILVRGSWTILICGLHCERLTLLKNWFVLALSSWNLTSFGWGLLWSYLTLNHGKMEFARILRFLNWIDLLELKDSWIKVINHLHLLLSILETINHLLWVLLCSKGALSIHMLTCANNAWSAFNLQVCHWLYLSSNNCICKRLIWLKWRPFLQIHFDLTFTLTAWLSYFSSHMGWCTIFSCLMLEIAFS